MGTVWCRASQRERIGVRYGSATRRARGQWEQEAGRGSGGWHGVGSTNRGATIKIGEAEADALTTWRYNEFKKNSN
jgi:hypothetical protein